MGRRRAHTVATGALLSVALLAGACGAHADTGEVSAESGDYGATLETSTTVSAARRLSGVGRSGSTPDPEAVDLAQKLKDNPELLGRLASMTPQQLAELTGLSVEQLSNLGITPASVSALGSLLVDSQDGSGNKELNPTLVNALSGAAGSLSQETVGALQRIDPAVLSGILGIASTVDPSLTRQLGALLKVVDPNGLGRFSEDNSALAVLAVVASATLGRDVSLENLANVEQVDPSFRRVMAGLTTLATRLTPALVTQINNIADILGPDTIAGMGAALGMLTQPAVSSVVGTAFKDPLVVASIFSAAFLLIPGLAQTVDPNNFTDERSRVAALGGLFVASLLKMNDPGVRDFLALLGVKVPPGLFGEPLPD